MSDSTPLRPFRVWTVAGHEQIDIEAVDMYEALAYFEQAGKSIIFAVSMDGGIRR